MKSSSNIVIIGLTLGLLACNSSAYKEEGTRNTTIDSAVSNKEITESLKENICIRAKAEPVIQKEDYPNTTFVLQADSSSAFETVSFDNGDELIIHNWGCEYYILTFRFETIRFQQDTANLEYWFRSAHGLMTSLLGGMNAPIDIKSGINFLDSYIDRDRKNDYKNLKLKEEIDFGFNEIRNFVTVDRIEQLTNEKFAVTISFAIGPL